MKYCFKSGRGKKVVISGNETFEKPGYEMLKAYHIQPEHLYCFEFSNGDVTDSASPLEECLCELLRGIVRVYCIDCEWNTT